MLISLGCLMLWQKGISQNPENKLGNWIGITSDISLGEKWKGFLQGEVRTWETASDLNELLWRAAVIYSLGPNSSAAIGYVRVDTWPYSSNEYRKFWENRSYQEYQVKHGLGRWKISHRFRLEQ